jgi:diguanylate cyclase (GGDEF)-like protein
MTGRSGVMAETLKLKDNDALGAQVKQAVRAKYRPALTIMSGKRVGERVSVQGNLLIGREAGGATVVLPDPGVSSRHAMLEDQGGSWTLVDLKSTNGTFVNGARVEEVELKSGDKIVFGATLVKFEVQDDADQAYSEMIEELVHIDDLTGLYIRRRFESELGVLIATALPASRSVGMLVMDLDGVKQINDTHGHLFGAYTIAESGKLIGRLIAGKGFACRFGGDEYIAALPDHTSEEAARFAEEVKNAIGVHAFVHEGVKLKPGISIGAAALPEHAQDGKSLFHAADEALYRAKRTGKNRVCRSGE